MKKIIPFEKTIEFNTNVSEITSISLEDDIRNVLPSTIEGELFLEGSYKINAASGIEEDFKYKIPVSVEVNDIYDINNVVTKIDNFYYEMFSDKGIKIYVDLLLDGLEEKPVQEDIEEEMPSDISRDNSLDEEMNRDESLDNLEKAEENTENDIKDTEVETEKVEEFDIIEGEENNAISEEQLKEVQNKLNEMIEKYEHPKSDEEIIRDYLENENNKIDKIDVEIKKAEQKNSEVNIMNLFSTSNESKAETYSTYSVYFVKEDDTLDRIVDKYKTSKEVLEEYNNPLEIKAGVKIIIPANHE